MARRFSWGLSALFGDSGGIGSCCGVDPTLQGGDTEMFVNPLQPGLLLGLAIAVLGTVVWKRASARNPQAIWAVPLIGAVVTGVLVAAAFWVGLPADLPASVPVVIGLTATACLLLLVGCYGTVLWAVQSWLAGPTPRK
jgi:hypothetical protein